MRAPEQVIASMWKRVMPASIPAPDDFILYLWSQTNLDDIQYAVERTSERMMRNIKKGLPADTDLAVRYATPILRLRAEWRAARRKQRAGQERGL